MQRYQYTHSECVYQRHDAALSRAMSAAWVRFAKTGDPNGTGLAKWPAYGADGTYMKFGDRIAAGTALRKKQLDALAGIRKAAGTHSPIKTVRESLPEQNDDHPSELQPFRVRA
jgi:hypothetical protein